jgi:L-2-hydroxyglutarate oxidase LhgO
LFEQRKRNGVELEMVSIEEARKKESRITGQDGSQALYSPNTAVVDIQACLRKLHSLCKDENPNYEAHYGASYKSWLGGREIDSTIGRISFKHLINCAGQ